MNYEQREVDETIRADSLWKMNAYRLALFACDVGWHDVTKLSKDRRTTGLASQLYEALGSISANLAEGYSRGTGKDRARFYEYSLGSARESRDWFFKGRHVLGEEVVKHRLALLPEIIRLLLVMAPEQRGHALRESAAEYLTESGPATIPPLPAQDLTEMLQTIPLPAPESSAIGKE